MAALSAVVSRRAGPPVERALDQLAMMRRGKFDLSWMRANPGGWGTRATRSDVGVTLEDINVGSYAEAPNRGAAGGGAPRGAEAPPGTARLPGYDVDEKAEVWADNAAELYDEGALRQWSSARDIPWRKLVELPDEIERAVCQICTQLTQLELVAVDVPARWIGRVSREFHEVKLFLAAQIRDEARHVEVFRKRALAKGGGLLQASPCSEEVGRLILGARSFTVASAVMYLLFEGFVMSLYRDGESLAPTGVEKKIFQLCMQDEARHIAYGIRHLKYFLSRHPEREAEIHAILAAGEEAVFALAMEPQTIEPRAVLAGGGVDRMQEGLSHLASLHRKHVREYLHRLELTGLDRSTRCKIPLELPQ